jgi:hypothetical protein
MGIWGWMEYKLTREALSKFLVVMLITLLLRQKSAQACEIWNWETPRRYSRLTNCGCVYGLPIYVLSLPQQPDLWTLPKVTECFDIYLQKTSNADFWQKTQLELTLWKTGRDLTRAFCILANDERWSDTLRASFLLSEGYDSTHCLWLPSTLLSWRCHQQFHRYL